jgi:hypothetical protein
LENRYLGVDADSTAAREDVLSGPPMLTNVSLALFGSQTKNRPSSFTIGVRD